MKKRILSVMLCLVMVLGLLPATALAETNYPTRVTIYKSNGEGAVMSIGLSDKKYLATNDAMSATDSWSDGTSYVARYDADTGTLYLNGYNGICNNSDSSGITTGISANTDCAITIDLKGTNSITVSNPSSNPERVYGVSAGQLTIRGDGSLTVKSTGYSYTYGIYTDKGMTVSAKVDVSATSESTGFLAYGLYANSGDITLSGADKTVTAKTQNTNSNYARGVYANTGAVSVGGKLTADLDSLGLAIYAKNDSNTTTPAITLDDGEVTITGSAREGLYDASSAKSEGTAGIAIKNNSKLTMTGTTGGDDDEGVWSSNNGLAIENSTVTITTHSSAVVVNQGTVSIKDSDVTLTTNSNTNAVSVSSTVDSQIDLSNKGTVTLKTKQTGDSVQPFSQTFTLGDSTTCTTGTYNTYDKRGYAKDDSNYKVLEFQHKSVAPSATVGDVTISGTVGTALSGTNEVTITLENDTFASSISGAWITNLPEGLSQSVSRTDDTHATITISGTPTAASSEPIAITIPAGALFTNSAAAVDVTSNEGAKFEIAKATVASPVAITGVTTPVKGTAASTSVTAPANTSATLKWYQSSSEFSGTYAASTSYTGEITIAPSSGYQFDASVSFTVNGTADWSATEQSDGSYKLTKEFTTASANLTGLEITAQPTKKNYTHGDSFDTTGMVVKATYDDSSSNDSFTDYTVEYATSGQTYLKKDNTEVTIKAGGQSVEVTGLTVNAKELTITGLTATAREYEKDNTTVALTGGTLTGVVGSEVVSVIMPTSGTVAAADAGVNKSVSVTKPVLSGADSGNYTLKDITGIEVTISPKSLTSAMIKLNSTQKTYDGSEQSAKFTVTDGTNDLTLDTDYTVTSGGTATNVATTTLNLAGKGNYTGTASTTWSLVAKDIGSAAITVSDTYTYTGSAITPTYTVQDGSTSLTASDYDAAYSNNTDAGSTAEITLTGKGNYQGTKKQPFTINKAEWGAPTETLTATNPTTSSGSDGKITGTTSTMQYKLSTGSSWTDCTGDVNNLSAGTYYVRYKEDSNHSASETNYKTVTLVDPGTTLYSVTVTDGAASPSGDQAAGAEVTITATAKPGYNFKEWTGLNDSYYKSDSTKASNPATFIMPASAVNVSATYEAAALTGTAAISGTAKYGETLTASLTDTNNTGNLSYKWYRGSDEITGATGSTYKLAEADIDKTITVEVGSSVQTGKISSTTSAVDKADGPAAPSAFALGFTLNADGETYTAIIPAVAGGEYSFDGTTYSASNTKADCQPNTSYTGYVRIAATSTHKASTATSSTQTSPKLAVATPTFTPNGASSFTGTQSVTISCATADAKIYYTTDGTTPTTSSTLYTTALSLTSTTTVKAIAVKTGMKDSAVTTATFTKYSGGGSSSGGSSYNPTYAVSVDKTENGSVSASPKNASKGTTVTVTTTPDKGWTLETLTVLDKNGKEVDLKIVTIGEKYTFEMPSGKVTVKATFMEDNTMLNYFVDVNARDYFYDAVLWAVEKGITDGTDELHFSPNTPCTRAQIVTFLWRAAGSPEPKSEGSFSDVKAGSYYAKAVAWAVENGITGGTGDGKFSPNATCTRAQAVTFLARALNARAESKAEFSDVPANAYYADAIAWAAENGVTTGIGGGLFDPNGSCTRAQIVVFLYRAYLGK